MANDIIDINVYETVETVEITVNPNLTTVNINKVTGGGGGGATDLAYISSPTNGIVTSSTGTSATIPLADGTNAGLITPAEKTKIANSVPYTGATTNVNLGEFELTTGQLTLDTTPTGTAAVATTRWNDSLGISETTLKGGTVVLKNGVDLVARIVNKVTPNTTLTKAAYQAVRISGAQGQRLAVELAQGNNDNNSADTIGLVTETIATNQEGFIITMGQIEDINTTGSLQSETWVDGDVLYLSPTVAGRLTNIKPTGLTGHIVVIGYVEYAHAIQGKIYVKVMNGWELDELHNVYINNPLNNQGLFYETSTQLWKNKSIATVLGYTPANDANVVHLTGNETISGTKTFGSNIVIPATGTALILSSSSGGTVSGLTTTTYPDLTELSYVKGVTSAIQNQLNGKVSTNTAITGATKTKITYDSKGLVTAGADATTADIADSTNKRYVTDADLTVIGNTSGTNTGDNATNTQYSGLATSKQDTLQSTVNIKSINGNSILGSGDLTIGGGSSAQTGTIIVTSGTSFTTPSNITTSTVFIIELIGAGGGGAGGLASNGHGSGAGGGGYVYKRITGLSPSTTYTCVIGTGGNGGVALGNGTSGTSTTLTIGVTTYTASGGGFGIATLGSAGGQGGTGTNGDININGQNGDYTALTTAATVHSSRGGGSPKGWGLEGAGVSQTTNGQTGTGYGGGGSSGKSGASAGGNGTNGIIYCQYFN